VEIAKKFAKCQGQDNKAIGELRYLIMQRLKILISAHELSPYQGSECAEGWNLVTRLAKYHDITVLYATGSQFKPLIYRQAVNDYFKANDPINGLVFVNIDQPWISKLIASVNALFLSGSSIGLPYLYFLGYKYWQVKAYRTAISLHNKFHFDIAHQLTQITFREPGYLWKTGIPFVWGPTGGISSLSADFHRMLSLKSRIFENIRSFINFYQFNYVSRIRKANKLASIIYAFSREDAAKFQQRTGGKIKLLLDAGTYSQTDKHEVERTFKHSLVGVWCGQLIERKAPSILLESLALVRNQTYGKDIKIKIIGSGPLKVLLHKMAVSLKLNNIEWIDSVSHDEIFSIMKSADFFIHTSFREATSNVIPEAISMGLPVICHDISGMSIAITERCGIKVPFVSPERSIKGFSDAMTFLLNNQEELIKLKIGAWERAKELSWDVMAESIANDYYAIINK
jgi:glycosyltransferase involved in cell wall biosynthesis